MSASTKKTAGFVAGATAFALVWLLQPAGLEPEGVTSLGLSLMAVVWWAAGVMPPGFSSAILLALFTLLIDRETAPLQTIFGLWITPTIYLVIGGFLLAEAVEKSGLGKRLSLMFISRFARGYRSIIISCYLLHILLSLMIPQPWPRSFLIMSVMRYIIKESGLSGKYAANIVLAVFASSIPTSMILLTGDSTLNVLVSSISGVPVTFAQWLLYMGPVGLLASILTCALQLMLFRSPTKFDIEPDKIKRELTQLGRINTLEIKVLAVLALAVGLWMTDSLTGIHPGWTALLAACACALPFMGVLDGNSFKQVPLGSLLFVSAAVAIGAVGGATGMNAWLAQSLLPGGGQQTSTVLFTVAAAGFCILVHMVLGSTMAVVSITGPAVLTFGASAGASPLVCVMLAYCAVALHWLLPFHHMNLLVGSAQEGDLMQGKQVVQFGAFQTLVVLAVCAAGMLWWETLGI